MVALGHQPDRFVRSGSLIVLADVDGLLHLVAVGFFGQLGNDHVFVEVAVFCDEVALVHYAEHVEAHLPPRNLSRVSSKPTLFHSGILQGLAVVLL